jgi:crotonobetainyl-CoA:carnitine CoA-transferase CaiB-like acyl-CoA transferase
MTATDSAPTTSPSGSPAAPPLAGLRVLELADGIGGPYAGRLLAMLGATVVKVEPPGGDPARRKQVDDVALADGETSPLYLHLNAGKHNVAAADAPPLTWADVVLHNKVRSQLAGTELDPSLPAGPDQPLLVTVTAWGFDADEPGTIEDELLVEAASGCIAVTGNDGDSPLRLPGWQAQYQAGATAAVGVLAALRMPGTRHLDVPWIAALQVGMELEFADRLMAGRSRHPSGPFPPAAFPGGALPCKDGHVCPGSYRDVDWEMQSIFYEMPDLYDDPRFNSRAARSQRVEELWELIKPWYASKTKREIFQYCLDSPWTVGMVITGTDALADEHLAVRGTVGTLETPDGPVRAPVRPFLLPGVPVADQRVRVTGESSRPDLAPAAPVERAPMAGLRMLELTVAWAGPFVGNFLGALGMDVIRLEAVRPFEGYRLMRLHPDSDPPAVKELRGTRDWLEASNIFCAVNRNKRGLALDLSGEAGQEVFRDLARNVDVVLCNFTERVLPGLGLGYDVLRQLNDDIVVVRMPAFGTSGPYSHCAGYALVVEAMGGFAARWGYPDEGARVSDTYWPDSVAGTHAALAVMTALERRDRTGQGCEIDFSHMDVMWSQLGEGLVVADRRGSDIGRMGNREPGVAGSGIFPSAGGGWEARVGDRSRPVVDVLGALADPGLAYRFETVDRDVLGRATELRAPVVVDGRPTTTRLPAPLFDQHSDAVLREVAGYDDARIAALREAKTVGGQLPVPKA